ncbi:RNA polymerase sigma factor [Roseivirga sp.]|uniref:RNA polymerase sigma factor n=1 Tax=Roseivirga sp. TaxID=1964215 RepID=UPI003B52C343
MLTPETIQKALEGDKRSLESIVNTIQPLIFNLSLRFLWQRADAEDATQEILIRVLTQLGKFEYRSKFETWVYRIATNHLLNQKESRLEKNLRTFQVFAEDLKTTGIIADQTQADSGLLEKEMKSGCTLAMLQCLNRDQRIAFILGSIFKIKSDEAAEITSTNSATFRKRLQISRSQIRNFLDSNCGVYNPANPCRCKNRLGNAINTGRINPKSLNFADSVDYYNEEMEELQSMSGIYHNHGQFKDRRPFSEIMNTEIMPKGIIRDFE